MLNGVLGARLRGMLHLHLAKGEEAKIRYTKSNTMSTGAIMASSSRATPAIPSVPTMNMRIACHIADVVLFKIGFCSDITAHSTSATAPGVAIENVPTPLHSS